MFLCLEDNNNNEELDLSKQKKEFMIEKNTLCEGEDMKKKEIILMFFI